MPYLEKIKDHISDFGWEIASIEYEIDVLPDNEECSLVEQIRKEIAFAYAVDECSWNKNLSPKKKVKRNNYEVKRLD